MKIWVAIIIALFFLLFTEMGCEELLTDQTFTLGQECDFRADRLYTSADGQYSLLIKEIADSRCPEGLICIWSGEVMVHGEWTANRNKSVFEIHSVVSQENKIPDGVTMKIIDAKPYPKQGEGNKDEEKVVTLLIQRK